MAVRKYTWSYPYFIFLAIFAVLPLILVAVYAFQDAQGHFTFANVTRFFSDGNALNTSAREPA